MEIGWMGPSRVGYSALRSPSPKPNLGPQRGQIACGMRKRKRKRARERERERERKGQSERERERERERDGERQRETERDYINDI